MGFASTSLPQLPPQKEPCLAPSLLQAAPTELPPAPGTGTGDATFPGHPTAREAPVKRGSPGWIPQHRGALRQAAFTPSATPQLPPVPS